MKNVNAGVADMPPHIAGAVRTAACRGSKECEGRTVTRIGWGSQSGDISSSANYRSNALAITDQPTLGRSNGGLTREGRHG